MSRSSSATAQTIGASTRRGGALEEELLRLLWEFPRLWRAAMDRRLKPLGLSAAKWRTLLLLSRVDRDVTQVEIAELLGIEAPTLARLLDRLSADGWVERRTGASDRRVKTIHLLPKASSAIKQIDDVIFTLRKEVLRNITRAEIERCATTLQKIRKHPEMSAAISPAAKPRAAK